MNPCIWFIIGVCSGNGCLCKNFAHIGTEKANKIEEDWKAKLADYKIFVRDEFAAKHNFDWEATYVKKD